MTRKNTKTSNDPWKDKIESVAPDIVFFVLLPLLTVEMVLLCHGPFNKVGKQDNNQVYKEIKQIETAKQDSIINYQTQNQR